ncbi:helix-turn-helix domain-containing protein [Phaeobacter piscinae]|uniref:helix-turn-helix domain-containing protein n=1 Tax=Phaeobacter piscinae TaxID=1580596 RepID=UPI000BBEE27E|nr:helix-turn-helix domain-containing protein [Phaeobacter piscinae]
MAYTLGEAAKATGKSKATISKAIKSGKISAPKGENGAYKIDPSELFRVYEPNRSTEQKETLETPIGNTNNSVDFKLLEAKLEAAEQRLQDRDDQLHDMREQRDRWQQQATALLADMRPKADREAKGFFKRLFG